jgi:hypothetical protein
LHYKTQQIKPSSIIAEFSDATRFIDDKCQKKAEQTLTHWQVTALGRRYLNSLLDMMV